MFLAFVCCPLVLVDTSGTSMSDSVLLATIRLVDDRTWTLTDEYDPENTFLTRAHDISVHEGRVFSGVGPGASVIAVPFYVLLRPVFSLFDDDVIASRRIRGYYMRNSDALGQPVAGHFKDLYLLQIGLVWCLVAPLFASFLTRLHELLVARGVERTPATAIVLAAGFGSMTLYYASMYSRQALAYLLVGHAILTLCRGARGRWTCILVGLVCGAAVSVDYAAVLLVGLGLVFLRATATQRLSILIPFGIVCGLIGLYHQAAFGSLLDTPYHHRFWHTSEILAARGLDLSVFQRGPALGLNPPDIGVMLRLCFGGFKGLFVYSPILLLGLIGHLRGMRRASTRRFHTFCLLVFLSYLAFNSTLGTHVPEFAHHFWGGLSGLWGPRYLFAVVPFLACGLAWLDWRRRAVRVVALALLVVSCVFNLLGVLFSQVMMATGAFGPELRFPLAYAFELLARLGPRVTLLDAYAVHPLVQSAALVGLALTATLLLCAALRESVVRGAA